MNKKVKIIIISIVSIVITVGGLCIYSMYLNDKMAPNVSRLVDEKKKSNYKDKDDNKKDIVTYHNILPDERNKYGNPNIMGRLEIPNLNINSLITRTDNNEYYLNYNLYNQYDELGVPFFDYRNIDLENDKQINIYGHNTRNEKYFDKLPFINLEAYTDKNIFDNYKDVYLSIDSKQVHYEVVAVKIVDKTDIVHMRVEFNNNDDYLIHFNNLLSNTMYKNENVTFNTNDRWLVLQVCHYNPDNTFLLVICKEIK